MSWLLRLKSINMYNITSPESCRSFGEWPTLFFCHHAYCYLCLSSFPPFPTNDNRRSLSNILTKKFSSIFKILKMFQKSKSSFLFLIIPILPLHSSFLTSRWTSSTVFSSEFSTFLMENLSHSFAKKSFHHGSGFITTASKSLYDDVFGGPPKFGVPTLAPRYEDYTEIFGGFHSFRAPKEFLHH